MAAQGGHLRSAAWAGSASDDRPRARRIRHDAPCERQIADLLDLLVVRTVEHIDRIRAAAREQELRAVRREAEVPAALADGHVLHVLVRAAVEHLQGLV